MKPKTDEDKLKEAVKNFDFELRKIVNDVYRDEITLAKEAKAEEIKINVMNDIKIWMAGRDCDIKVIDDILGKHTR